MWSIEVLFSPWHSLLCFSNVPSLDLQIIPSTNSYQLESVIWIKGILFASGINGFLCQYDLLEGRIKVSNNNGMDQQLYVE